MATEDESKHLEDVSPAMQRQGILPMDFHRNWISCTGALPGAKSAREGFLAKIPCISIAEETSPGPFDSPSLLRRSGSLKVTPAESLAVSASQREHEI